MKQSDKMYLDLVLEPIRVSAKYKPKFGQGEGGLNLAEFQRLYSSDPFYKWLGLDDPMMYAAHKAAGGMTSIYRQIGIGCEKLVRTAMKDALELSEEDVKWSYGIPLPNGKTRRLYLDGRVSLDKIQDKTRRNRFHAWMRDSARSLGIAPSIFSTLTGTVFEIRQGYKSKDSKRQNADIANAATAYTQTYLPCAIILSTQIDGDILLRYKAEKWAILTGSLSENDPSVSTYDFMRDIVGFDLASFFKRNSKILRTEIRKVLKSLLSTGGK